LSPLTACLEHRLDRQRIQPSARGFLAEDVRRRNSRKCGTVRTRLRQSSEDVGNGQRSGGRRQAWSALTAVIAGAIQPLVVPTSKRGSIFQRAGLPHHPLGVVSVQADFLRLR
jgi:hypothetical protein